MMKSGNTGTAGPGTGETTPFLISTYEKTSGDNVINITKTVENINNINLFFLMTIFSLGRVWLNNKNSGVIGIAQKLLIRTQKILLSEEKGCKEINCVIAQIVKTKPKTANILFVALFELIRKTKTASEKLTNNTTTKNKIVKLEIKLDINIS